MGEERTVRARRHGQVIIEMMVALSVAVVALASLLGLLAQSYSLSRTAEGSFTATYLASEGIEVVKNIIDANYQRCDTPWNSGFAPGWYEVDYNSKTLENANFVAPGRELLFDPATKMYSYDAGNPVPEHYYRRIDIDLIGDYAIQVKSTVTWRGRHGNTEQVVLEDQFYNWPESDQPANCGPAQTCSDNTPLGTCSNNRPLYCDANGVLVDNCNDCGCPPGELCQTADGTCSPTPLCDDGTSGNTCSDTQPLFCDTNSAPPQLVPDCQTCGCPDGSVCDTTTLDCVPACQDDTPVGRCSATKPYFCDANQNLIEDCNTCGCNVNEVCDVSGKCVPGCSDGTRVGECAANQPKFCGADYSLVDNCQKCGCPPVNNGRYQCEATGSCTYYCPGDIQENTCDPNNQPKYCDPASQSLVDKCTVCGCPPNLGYACDAPTDTCVLVCQDGTRVNQCSANQPKYCDPGSGPGNQNLIDNCQTCGCPDTDPRYACMPSGSCVICSGIMLGDANSNLAYDIAVDTSQPALYIVGNFPWRIEKRNPVTGDLDPNFGAGGVISVNGASAARGVAVDGQYLYAVGGSDSHYEWRIEKRTLDTGALCDAATCGTEFGTGGATSTPNVYAAHDIAIDAQYMYVVGGYHSRWRIEKRTLDTGDLCDAATCGTEFGTGGATSSDAYALYGIAIDSQYMYVVGRGKWGSHSQWRIEKRTLDTGDLCDAATCGTEFGTGGVILLSDSDSNRHYPVAVAVDESANAMYVFGWSYYERGWFIEKRALDTGDLDTTFGGGKGWISDLSGEDPGDIVIDANAMYLVGKDANSYDWLIEKRTLDTGDLDPNFGAGGKKIVPDGSTLRGIAINTASSSIYVAGDGDNNDWRMETRSTVDGSLICN